MVFNLNRIEGIGVFSTRFYRETVKAMYFRCKKEIELEDYVIKHAVGKK